MPHEYMYPKMTSIYYYLTDGEAKPRALLSTSNSGTSRFVAMDEGT